MGPVVAGLQSPESNVKGPIDPSMKAFLELAFRPLYLAGVGWALVAIALWIYAPSLLTAPLGGVAWHAHEMLWGFIATIALAFLMTAGANWTGINPMSGKLLALACVLSGGCAYWFSAALGDRILDCNDVRVGILFTGLQCHAARGGNVEKTAAITLYPACWLAWAPWMRFTC